MPKPKFKRRANGLVVQMDGASKKIVTKAAELRQLSPSDYVRQMIVPQARREVAAAAEQTVKLTPDEQLALWTALNEPVRLTPAQIELGKIMRGEL